MLLDDRLATVLGSPIGGEAAARTQFRQLVDLLGAAPAGSRPPLDMASWRRLSAQADALSPADRERLIITPALTTRNPRLLDFLAWQRLRELGDMIPEEERSRILREPGLRLRNPQVVAMLAEGDAKPAAAALATARLAEAEWLALIPQLPVVARGFLRHRRDLPPAVRDLLAQLGVRDLLLPEPEALPEAAPEAPPETQPETAGTGEAAPAPAPPPTIPEREGIRDLLRRIEAFREGRRTAPADPRLPLGDMPDEAAQPALAQFAFTTDTENRIAWAEGPVAPLVCGLRLGAEGPGALAVLDPPALRAVQQRQPIGGARLVVDAAPVISGEWRVDAEPVFAVNGGHFTGYRGRVRRPVLAPPAPVAEADSPQDRMRQALHELRTPVNAIQGFAEIIQQQLFGPVPNAYRAHAAAVAVDAAKLLASFEEIDRLSKLESGALALEGGAADLREAVDQTIRRIDGVLRSRNAGFDLTVRGDGFATALAREELMVLVWRVLASLAGSLAPLERVVSRLESDGERATLTLSLPGAVAQAEDPFAIPAPDPRPVLSAGMFGPGFSFRLARAEAVAAGGRLDFSPGLLTLELPLLTAC